jgi:hypothetical protein
MLVIVAPFAPSPWGEFDGVFAVEAARIERAASKGRTVALSSSSTLSPNDA